MELAKLMTTEEGRAQLPPRPAPYYVKIGPGQYIGLGRQVGGDVWKARLRATIPGKAGEFEQRYETLGRALSYEQALAKAFEWFRREGAHVKAPELGTVAQACAKYIEHLRLTAAKPEKNIRAFENTITRNVVADAIGGIPVEELDVSHVNTWRERLLKGERSGDGRTGQQGDDGRRAAARGEGLRPIKPASVNRIKKNLFSCLNWCADHGYIKSRAWCIKKNLREQVERPGQFIEPAHCAQLLDAATGRVRDFMLCEELTGARPVEFLRATREDLDLTSATPQIRLVSFKGKDAVERVRFTGIPARALPAFKRFAAGKLPKAPLFTRDDGQPFTENEMSLEFTALAQSIGLGQYRLYDYRHTRIASLLADRVDPQAVAESCGTSLQIIDKHYRKYLPKQAVAQVAASDNRKVA